MRDVFFEDEIDHFGDTVRSILINFLRENKYIPASVYLTELILEIENGLDNSI